MPDYINDLHELSVDARGELDNWLALRQLERRGSLALSIDDADLRSRMLTLVEAGNVVVRAERHRLLWTRSAYRISAAGQRTLELKREELERLHAEIGSAIATAGEALASRGIDPGVLLLERMILLHHRFDDERSGFFTGCERLAGHVRDFTSAGHGASDDPALVALLALFGATR